MLHLTIFIYIIQMFSLFIICLSVHIHISKSIKIAVIIHTLSTYTFKNMLKIIKDFMTIFIKINYVHSVRMICKPIFHWLAICHKIICICSICAEAVMKCIQKIYSIAICISLCSRKLCSINC